MNSTIQHPATRSDGCYHGFMFEEHAKNGPFMWEMRIGAYLFGEEIKYVSMTSEYGYPDWIFLYSSTKRDARDLIWQGWAWERVADVVTTDEH